MKTIIITGASQGIGAELVKLSSKEEGLRIYALSRNEFKLKSLTKYKNVIPYKIDLIKEKEILKFVDHLKEQNISINYLINNAGLLINKSFSKYSYSDINKTFQTNVFAPMLLIKNLLSFFTKSAHILNIGSVGGVQGSLKFPGLSAYSSSKAALAVLTECLAEEYKDSKLVFNCLALGATQTEMFEKAFPKYKAPVTAYEMACFIKGFVFSEKCMINGKIIPVSSSNP